jgi:CRISPR/Cas system-associated endonuclease Cas1
MTEKQYNELVEIKIAQIFKAVRDHKNDPNKAEEYIHRTIKNIAEAGKQLGQMSIADELFG